MSNLPEGSGPKSPQLHNPYTMEDLIKKHTWLLGDSFIKRAFAIWGYSVAAMAMVYGAMILLALVIGIIGGIISAF